MGSSTSLLSFFAPAKNKQTFSGSFLFENYYLEVVSIICSESTKGRQAESKREQETRLAQAGLEDSLHRCCKPTPGLRAATKVKVTLGQNKSVHWGAVSVGVPFLILQGFHITFLGSLGLSSARRGCMS